MGSELERIGRNVAGRRDIVNVMGREWSRGIKGGTRVISCQNSDCVVVISRGNGACKVRRVNGSLTFSGDCVAARAHRRKPKNGNSLLAVSYAMNQPERVVAHYECEKPVRKTKTQAAVWKLSDNGKRAFRVKSRHNRFMERSVQRTDSDSTAKAADPCGRCLGTTSWGLLPSYRLQ